MIKAVIFDMDGVLIDTVTFGRHLRGKILADHYNISLNDVPDPQGEDHRIASMKTLLASVESCLGIHIDLTAFAELQAKYMRDELPKLISPDPSLVTFLDELKRHDVTCAIVTTAQRSGADIKLDVLGIRQYFSVVVTGDEIENHKPHPDAYLYALDKLHLPADECVIIEDSLPGIQAGLAAGCRVIGFTQYNPPKEPLYGVSRTIKRWSDMHFATLGYLEKTGADV